MMGELRQGGFTLIEILVAVAVFALVAAMAYGGLSAITRQKDTLHASMAQLKKLQLGFNQIARDMSEVVQRPIRRANTPKPVPAFKGTPSNDLLLVLTRGGWRNPLALQRGTLQRVAYKIEDEKLLRLTWKVLDRLPSNKPVRQVIFDHVTDFKLHFLNGAQQWATRWPPQNKATLKGAEQLPIAIKIDITLAHVGRITRLIELPQ